MAILTPEQRARARRGLSIVSSGLAFVPELQGAGGVVMNVLHTGILALDNLLDRPDGGVELLEKLRSQPAATIDLAAIVADVPTSRDG